MHAVGQVVEAPERWPESEPGTRRYVFPRFPFRLVYRVVGETIQIIAVAIPDEDPDIGGSADDGGFLSPPSATIIRFR